MLGWFRRHATVLMVVLGSAAMAIFGLGPVFDYLARNNGSTGGENPVVATWSGGKVYRRDLNRMRQLHYSSQRFLRQVVEEAGKRRDNFRPLAPMLPQINDADDSNVESQLLERMIYAEKAKKEGFVPSDALVDNYLGLLSADAGFTPTDFQIINRTANQQSTSLKVIKEHLKTELLYTQMLDFLYDRFQTSPPNPTEAMELYHRTFDSIECLTFPVSVESKLAQVNETPSPAEIKKLYEEGKADFPDMEGLKPGFKVGRKVNVQYLVANFDKFLQAEMAKVTDEDVQKEYDRLVEAKSFIVMEPISNDNSFEMQTPPPSSGGAPEGTDGEAPDDVDAPPMTEEPKSEEPKTEEPKAEEPKAEEPKAEEPKAEEPKTEEPKTEEPKTEEPKAEEPKAEEPKTEEPKAEEPKTEEPKVDPPKSGEGESRELSVDQLKYQFVSTAAQDPQEETPATEPADVTPPPQENAAAPAAQETPATPITPPESNQEPGGLPGGLTLEDDKPAQKVKPLKDVVDEVKRSLCTPLAIAAMGEAIRQAEEEAEDYYAVKLELEDEDRLDELEPFNHKEIAEKLGLDAIETGLVDFEELSKTPFGGMRSPQGGMLASEIMGVYDNLQLFEPQTMGGNFFIQDVYLFWFSDKADSKIPELKDCQDQIVKYWQLQKAREMAVAEAESIQAKVNADRQKKMSEVIEGATETGAFSWFNSQSGAISQPANVKFAGDEFMETAFSLGEMEAGVAASADNETIYVIQSLTGVRSPSEFGNAYLSEQFMRFQQVPQPVNQASEYYLRSSQRALAEQLREEMKFKRIE